MINAAGRLRSVADKAVLQDKAAGLPVTAADVHAARVLADTLDARVTTDDGVDPLELLGYATSALDAMQPWVRQPGGQ